MVAHSDFCFRGPLHAPETISGAVGDGCDAASCVTSARRWIVGWREAFGAVPEKPDYTLHISPVNLEIAPNKIASMDDWVQRLRAGLSARACAKGNRLRSKFSTTRKKPELVHWHGLMIPSEVDGASQEGTPFIAPHSSAGYSFVPRPAGTRWYHTHVEAGRNLKRSTYTGQFGILYIEPKSDPGAYDAEIFLTLHGWDGYLGSMGAGGDECVLEAVYNSYSVDGHALGHGEPIRVSEGQKKCFSASSMRTRRCRTGSRFRGISSPC